MPFAGMILIFRFTTEQNQFLRKLLEEWFWQKINLSPELISLQIVENTAASRIDL